MPRQGKICWQRHFNLTIEEQLHFRGFGSALIASIAKEASSNDSKSKLVLRMQRTQFLEDGFALAIDIANDDSMACISSATQQNTYRHLHFGGHDAERGGVARLVLTLICAIASSG